MVIELRTLTPPDLKMCHLLLNIPGHKVVVLSLVALNSLMELISRLHHVLHLFLALYNNINSVWLGVVALNSLLELVSRLHHVLHLFLALYSNINKVRPCSTQKPYGAYLSFAPCAAPLPRAVHQ
jgi:hypothetical protein